MNDKVKYGFIDRTGEIHITNEGCSIEIIEYTNSNNCTIRFEDGTLLTKRYYVNIIKGKVKKPKEDIDHIGEEHITKQGYKIKITEYHNKKNCTVLFENGVCFENKSYLSVVSGTILNPYHPTLYGIGFLGQGKYTANIGKKQSKVYNAWNKILERCYSEKLHKRKPTYKGVVICDEWKCFQVFAEWYYNSYNFEIMDSWALDKDILFKGNKVYSPKTCCFIPQEINSSFTNRKSMRGKLPIGVRKIGKRYVARIKHANSTPLDTIEEAFQLYKFLKEKEIKRVADKWKLSIEPKVYEAMCNWKIEITD